MTEPGRLPDEDMLLAAELALGLIEGPELAAAIARERDDAGFAREVARWRTQAGTWLEALPSAAEPAAADPATWLRIERSLAREATAPGATRPPAAANDDGGAVRRWRALAIAASLACVFLGSASLYLLGERRTGAPASSAPVAAADPLTDASVAQISRNNGAPVLGAVYNARTGTLQLSMATLDTVDKAPELWVIDGAGTPHSLGLVEAGGKLKLALSSEVRRYLDEGAAIAITLENRAGAPHKAPQGQMLGSAKLLKI